MLLLLVVLGLINYYVYKSITPPPPIPLPENVSEISPRISSMMADIYRLSGASLVAPLVNFWWSRVPQNLLNAAMKKLPFGFRMTLGVAHYFPWLLYWWMTQKWFPNSRNPKDSTTERDIELAEKHTQHPYIKESALRQGECLRTQRDIIAGYGNWGFDPTELSNPSSDSNEGSVHMWCALEDKQISRDVLLYICDKLPWIKLHEVPDGGHYIIHEKRHFEAIIEAACT